jgi:hypothetical protein
MAFDPTEKKKCLYRCSCGAEWSRWFDRSNRKVRSWCSQCKMIVTPYQTIVTNSVARIGKVRAPRPLW